MQNLCAHLSGFLGKGRLVLYPLPLFLVLLLLSCSKVKVDSNCLNEKSTCFKADKTKPLFQSSTPSPGQTISKLDYVDIVFSEELKDPKPSDFGLQSPGNQLSIAKIDKISTYTYRLWISGAVQNGDIIFDFTKLRDYNNNFANGTLTLKGNIDIGITFDTDPVTNPGYHEGVSNLGVPSYGTTTIRFKHDYDGDDPTNANVWKVYRTTGVTSCTAGPTVVLLASYGASTLAANSYISFTLSEAADFPTTEGYYRIVVCINNVAKNKFGAQGILIARDNSIPAVTVSPYSTTDEYNVAQTVTASCSDNATKIAYQLAPFNTWTGVSTDPLDPPSPDFTVAGAVDTAGGSVEYLSPLTTPAAGFIGDPINPVRSKYKFRCIDKAGNKSAIIPASTSPIYLIDNTLPEVVVTLDSSFRAFITNNIPANNSTTIRFTTNQPAGQTYKIVKDGTSCNVGGTDMVPGSVTPAAGTVITHNFATGAAFNQFAVGPHTLRICVRNPAATKWGVAVLTVTRDDSVPTVTPSVASGTYGSLQSVELACSDNADKLYLTSAEGIGATVPSGPANPTLAASEEWTGPFVPTNDRTTVIKWICVDKAGNQSVMGSAQYTIDTIIPTVTIVSNEHIAVSSVATAFQSTNLTFTSSRGGLIYRIMRGTTDCVTGATQIGTDQPVPAAVNGVVPPVTVNLGYASFPGVGVNYDVKVCVFNNAAAPGYNTSTLQIRRDDTAPTILPANLTAAVTANGGNSFTFSWNAADDTGGSGVAVYRIFRSLSAAAGSFTSYPGSPEYSVAATPGINSATITMPDNQKYFLRIVPVDMAGNIMALAAGYNVIATNLILSVSVSGYTAGFGDLVIRQGSDVLTFTSPMVSPQSFATNLGGGSVYNVGIVSQPGRQNCAFTSNQYGSINTDLTLAVQCVPGYFTGNGMIANAPVPLNFHLYRGNSVIVAGGSTGTNCGATCNNGTGSANIRFDRPHGITHVKGVIYTTEYNTNQVRQFAVATANMTTLAGASASGSTDDPTGTNARFNQPNSITTDGVSLYVSELAGQRIRRISLTAPYAVTTLAGGGTTGTPCPGVAQATCLDGPALTARFVQINHLHYDNGFIYIADFTHNRVRRLNLSSGTVETIAGTGAVGANDGDGVVATLNGPAGLTSAGGYLYVADINNNKIRRISTTAPFTVTTVVGTGVAGKTDGPTSVARISGPDHLTTDGSNLFISDFGNNIIRRLNLRTNIVSTISGYGSSDVNGVGPAAGMASPVGIVHDGRRLFTVSHNGNNLHRIADQGLVGYWPIAPGVNPNDYNSDNSNLLNGTVVSGPLGTAIDRFGNANLASNFSGSQYITAGTAGLPAGNAPRTMCAWAKPNAAPTGTHLIATYGNTNSNESFGLYLTYFSGIQHIAFSAYGGAGFDIFADYTAVTTEWMHLCASYDSAIVHLYLNGKQMASAARTLATGAGGLAIGAQQGGIQNFSGAISDVRIYSRTLSEGEINELAQDATAAQVGSSFSTGATGLLSHYRFDQGSETMASGPIGGTLTSSGTKTPVVGKDGDAAGGGAVHFNGNVNNYYSGSAIGLPTGAAPRTMCAYLSPSAYPSPNTNNNFVSYGILAGTFQGFGLALNENASGTTESVTNTFGSSGDLVIAYRLALNTWSHYCSVYDGTVSKLYINGVLLGSSTVGLDTGNASLRIGSWIDGNQNGKGKIDDVRIYDNALSANQVRQLATQVPEGLVLRLDTNGDATDISGFAQSLLSNTGSLTSGRYGIANTAYRFTSGQLAQFAHSDTLTNMQDLTISFWMHSPDLDSTLGSELVTKYSSCGADGWTVKYDNSTFFQAQCGGGAAIANRVRAKNVWMHYTYVRTGAASRNLYINGADVTSSTPGTLTAVVPNTVPLKIAGGTGDKTLQDIRIYNRALAPSEVRALSGYHVLQSTPGLSLHIQADTFSNLNDSDTIATNWTDSSPTPYNAAGGIVNGAPRYVTGSSSLLGKKPAIEFDNTVGKYFNFGFTNLTYTGLTVCAAATRKGNGYVGLIEKRITSGSDINSWGMITNNAFNQMKFEMGAPPVTSVIDTVTDDTPSIYCMVSGSGNRIQTLVNGQVSQTVPGTVISGSNSAALFVGSRYDGGGSYYGQIGEAFVHTTGASSAELILSECYLSAKYSIPLTSSIICP